MKSLSWKSLAELAGMAAIVGSLIFVGLQIRQEQVIALSELNLSLLASQIELNNSISDNADIWVRGNAGEELSQAERIIYESLSDNMAYLQRDAAIDLLRRLIEFRRAGAFFANRWQPPEVPVDVGGNVCCRDIGRDVLVQVVPIDLVERVIGRVVVIEVMGSVLPHAEHGHTRLAQWPQVGTAV